MARSLRGLIAVAALLAPSASLAQVQVNQVFNLQGPSPSIGPISVVQSGDIPGPPLQGSVAGAVQVVVPDPSDAKKIYIGAPNGGVWATSDGGNTWKPLTDKQATLSISSLDIDPTDSTHKTLIAGSGATSSSCLVPSNCYVTSGGTLNGLLYSQDGGKTWASLGGGSGPLLAQSGPLSNQFIAGVAARGSNIFAATFQMSFFAQSTTAGGLYLSQDGGTSFKPISGTNGLPLGPVTSLVGVPGSPGTLYAAVTASSSSRYAESAVYVTTDMGANWKKVFSKDDSGLIQSGSQTAIKLAASSGAVAIGIMNLKSTTVTGLFWSQNPSPGSWTALGAPAANTLNNINQIPINFAIAIDPKNPNMIYLSGDESVNASNDTVPVYRVDASASNPQFISIVGKGFAANDSTTHSDSRSLAFDANGNLLLTSDGGVYLRTNPQSSVGAWQFLNGNLSNFQTYAVAYDSLNKRLAVAAQDNGVSLQPGTGNTSWNAQIGADGTNVVINSKFMGNMTAMYFSTDSFNYVNRIVFDANGNRISPSTSGFGPGTTVNCSYTGYSNCTTYGSNGGNSPFLAPIVLNRSDPSMIAIAPGNLFGQNQIYVGQDTSPASEKAVNLTMTSVGTVDANSTVTVLAYGIPANNNTIASANPNALLAGVQSSSSKGELWFSSNVGSGGSPLARLAAYTQAGGLPPTSMVFDPTSPSAPGQIRFYVVDGTNLYGTQNQGGQFSSLTGYLPAGFTRPLAVEFISNNGVNALLIGGLNIPLTCTTSQPDGCNISSQQSPITVADSDGSGNLLGWRAFGQRLPNTQISMLSYNADVDVLAVGTYGRGAAVLYDVTSYFSQATTLQFGLANNDSQPDASFLTDGTSLSGAGFSRPLNKYGTGTLIIAGAATYTGGTAIYGGALQLGNGGASGSILGNVAFCSDATNPLCDTSTNKMLVFNRSDTYSFDGAISGPGQVVQFGSGKTVLTAVNTYSGPTFVLGGTLSVNGSITSSVFVETGGTLGGNGTVGSTMVLAGGALSPGNSVGTLTVNGNLVFSTASLYMVEVQGNSADRTNVSGTATLAGIVGLSHLGGKLSRSYTILSAAGGRTGTFDALVTPNLPTFITASLAYTPTDVQLDLTSGIRRIPGLTRNHAAVAAALDRGFDSGGSLLGLYGLTPSQIPAALDMLSGEGVSGTQETAFGAAGMFNSIMMDQGAFWRNRETVDVNGVTFAGEPLAYAAEKKSKTSEYPAFRGMLTKEPPTVAQPRWRAWLTGFDGTWKLDGEADPGSATLSHNTGGLAGGLDYQFAPDLLAGFAIGGSSSNFSVRDRITSGNLEGAHFGGYGVKTGGQLYAAGALSFSTFRNSETRSIVGIGPTEMATGTFGSNLLSGRVEAGWKQSFNWFAVTPFAAVQVSQLWQNAFTETNPIPAGATDPLGLSYSSRSVTSLPTFLGAQFDSRFAVWNGMALSPYARLSWVHEFKPDRAINPSFIALPAASFTVDGPRAASDAARIDAGAKLAITPNAWLFASFDGEFSSRSQSYAGKGGARITW